MIYDYTIQYSFQDQHEKIYQTTYSYIIKTDVNCFLPSFVSFETSLTRNSENHIVLQSRGILVVLCFFMEGRFEKKNKTNFIQLEKSLWMTSICLYYNSRQMKPNFPYTNRVFAFAFWNCFYYDDYTLGANSLLTPDVQKIELNVS